MADTIKNYFEYAQLMQASYATLSKGMSDANYLTALGRNDFTTVLRESFVDTYEIIDQKPNTAEGFSATVFKNRQTGEYTLAIRGTESDLAGLIQDLARADLADIGGDGIAVSQSLDLFNYYQDITAKQGQPVYHYHLVQERVPLPGYPLGLQLGGFGYISVTQVGVAAADGVLADKNFTVAGHSLGGHLALVMSRLDPSHVDAVYSYNAPGFDTRLIPINNNTELFFSKLAEAQASSSGTTTIDTTAFPVDKLNNLAVPLDIISDIGEMPGGQIFHFNEATGLGGLLAAHLKAGITDAFAVYNLIADLDSDASLEQITNILKASAIRESESLESLIEDLYILFENLYPAGFVGPRPQIDRETMYQYIQTIQVNQNFQLAVQTGSVVSLAGMDAAGILAAAQVDTGVMYALQHLNPFAITGENAIYAQHNTQGQLDITNFTDHYLEDRANFLENYITGSDFASNVTNPEYYQDIATGTVLDYRHDSNFLPTVESSRYVFGGTGNDILTGGGREDHLYGGDGKDTLVGGGTTINGGSDYLEGGEGDDTYIVTGNSTIYDQDDVGRVLMGDSFAVLTGGILQAGGSYLSEDGRITYTLNANGTLSVTDGTNNLTIESFESGDLGIALTDNSTPPPPTDLTINGTESADTIDPNSSNASTNGNDLIYGLGGNDTISGYGGHDEIHGGSGNDVIYSNFSPLPPGEAANPTRDEIYGDAGNDLVQGSGADDHIEGGADNDILVGANGNDNIAGGTGDDIVYGGWGQDTLAGDAGHDFLTGDSGFSGGNHTDLETVSYTINYSSSQHIIGAERETAAGNTTNLITDYSSAPELILSTDFNDQLTGGTDNDILFGGAGNDILHGNEHDDYAYGSAGNDIINGGSGNDHLYGDGNPYSDPSTITTTDVTVRPEHEGKDTILGGTGDDKIYGGGQDDYLSGGAGVDEIYGQGGDDQISGGDNNDILIGDDVFAGGPGPQGNDTIDGGAGDDQIRGVGGDDLLYGGAGNDVIDGDLSNLDGALHGLDLIYGGSGTDTLIGNGGGDIIYGGSENDTIYGDASGLATVHHGDDTLYGDGGDDVIYGGAGNDTLDGGSGNDQLIGGVGNDRYFVASGDGNDVVLDEAGTNDVLQLGLASSEVALVRLEDTLVISVTATGQQIDLQDWFVSDSIEAIHFSDGEVWDKNQIEQSMIVTGTDADDVLTGTDNDDHILGLDGNDTLNGLFGNDILEGGNGNDRLQPGGGNNVLIGGGGNDILFSGGSHVTENNTQTLDGGPGNDLLNGSFGNDIYLFGRGMGQDSISTLFGGGEDVIKFDESISPDDIEVFVDHGDIVLKIIGTNEFIEIGSWFGNDFVHKPIDRVEFFDGTVWTAEDISKKFPGATVGDDLYLEGTTGNDIIDGLEGNDRLYGNEGNDRLIGGVGNDRLLGGIGNDTLDGGEGVDILDGGHGDDVYVFSRGDGNQDIYSEISGYDVLKVNVSSTEASLVFDGYQSHYKLVINDTDDSFSIRSTGTSLQSNVIEEIQFNDGVIWVWTDFEAIANQSLNSPPQLADDNFTGIEDEQLVIPLTSLLENDTDPDGDNLTVNGVGIPSHGIIPQDGQGNVLFTPAPNYNGLAGFVYYVSDGQGNVVSANVNIEIAAVNDAPTGYFQPLTDQDASEGNMFSYTIPEFAFYDPDGDALTYSATQTDGSALPTWLSFDVATQAFSGTPASGDAGNLDLLVMVTDPSGESISDSFSLDVSVAPPINTTPQAVADTLTGTEDQPLTITAASLLANDSDADGDTLSVTAVNNASHGTVGIDANGDITFTPETNYHGPASFDYTISDGQGGTASTTASIDITAVNDVPTLVQALTNQNASEGIAFSYTLAANSFTDVDGDILTYSATLSDGSALPTWLNFDVATQSFSGTPATGDAANLNLLVTANDPSGASVSDNFSIDITSAPPTSENITLDFENLTLGEHTDLTLNGFHISSDGGSLDVVNVADEFYGSTSNVAIRNGGWLETTTLKKADDTVFDLNSFDYQGIWSDGTATITGYLADGSVVTDTFAYAAESSQATITLNWANLTHVEIAFSSYAFMDNFSLGAAGNSTNVVPQAVADSLIGNEDQPLTIVAATLLANDTDADGDSLNIAGVSNAAHGSVALDLNGDTVFTPEANYHGLASFDYTVSDGNGGTAAASVSIDIASVNDAPSLVQTLTDQTASEGNAFSYAIAVNSFTDLDSDTLAYSATQADGSALPAWLSFNAATQAFTGTPSSGDAGNLNLLVTATDPSGASVSDSFSLDVSVTPPSNTAPLAVADNLTGTEDQVLTIAVATLLANDSDADGDALSITGVNNASHGTVSLDVNGDIIFTPDANYHGPASFDYTISDGQGGTASTTASIDITADTTQTGTSGDDTLYGTSLADTLDGAVGDDRLYGRDGDDTLIGGEGNDRLNGQAGSDSMEGGIGNDYYFVDNAGDSVIEQADEGVDRVYSTLDYTLGGNIEQLVLQGEADLNGTGNSLANNLYGNIGANTLTGGLGDDRLYGREGDDTLIGGEGNDRLNGQAGSDSMEGGIGNDYYFVDNAGDSVIEQADEGIDRVYSTVDYTLGENLEQLVLQGEGNLNGTGNSFNNNLYGNTGANTLTGGFGDDLLYGRDGDDTLIAGEGNDRLNGQAGSDSMEGGAGDDYYYVDNTGDSVIEQADEGVDRVYSTLDYALGDNLEQLVLQGEADLNGSGNSFNNNLYGNTGANVLSGGVGDDRLYGRDGNDTLIGGAGNDRLYGQAGDDLYQYQRGDGRDTLVELANEGNDSLQLSGGINHDQLWFSQQGKHLKLQVIGTDDQITISNWYAADGPQLETITASDGLSLTANQVEQLVSAMAAFAPPVNGELTLPDDIRDQLAPTLAASWG